MHIYIYINVCMHNIHSFLVDLLTDLGDRRAQSALELFNFAAELIEVVVEAAGTDVHDVVRHVLERRHRRGKVVVHLVREREGIWCVCVRVCACGQEVSGCDSCALLISSLTHSLTLSLTHTHTCRTLVVRVLPLVPPISMRCNLLNCTIVEHSSRMS